MFRVLVTKEVKYIVLLKILLFKVVISLAVMEKVGNQFIKAQNMGTHGEISKTRPSIHIRKQGYYPWQTVVKIQIGIAI